MLYECDECGERHFIPGPCVCCGSLTSELVDVEAFTSKLASIGAYGVPELEKSEG